MLKDSRPIRNSQRRERVREEVVKELQEGVGLESVDQAGDAATKGGEKKS
jgi:hypothetical protein